MDSTFGTEAGAPPARVDAQRAPADSVGAESLSVADLIARVAGSRGAAGACAELATLELAEVARRSPRDLCVRSGLTPAAAVRLAAAFELGRRVERTGPAARAPMNAPALVHAVAAPLLRGLDREEFHAFLLDTRHRLLRTAHISTGTLSTSLVHPREVYAAALREAAAAIVVVHNHPSGDPEPSAQDLEVTRRLVQVGALVGVPLLDHVVVGADRWVSLRERMPW
ncbi:MAG: DNA repair protein RadC [Planctomycetota bacterium]|nr:DNA repair protein RadC [Planctomycetota bacterium]